LKPSEIERKLNIVRDEQIPFDPAILLRLCSSFFPQHLLRDVDGVRQLQEVALEEYARQVAEPERADAAGTVYEKVAVWVARTTELRSRILLSR